MSEPTVSDRIGTNQDGVVNEPRRHRAGWNLNDNGGPGRIWNLPEHRRSDAGWNTGQRADRAVRVAAVERFNHADAA